MVALVTCVPFRLRSLHGPALLPNTTYHASRFGQRFFLATTVSCGSVLCMATAVVDIDELVATCSFCGLTDLVSVRTVTQDGVKETCVPGPGKRAITTPEGWTAELVLVQVGAETWWRCPECARKGI